MDIRLDSRYLLTPLVKSTDGHNYLESWVPLDVKERGDERVYTISDVNLGRHDIVAQILYSNPTLWWIYLHFNEIEDPFSEFDFSDCDDHVVYPNYDTEGSDAKLSWPDAFTTANLISLGIDPSDIQLSDFPLLLKGLRVPEFMSGSKFNYPSRSTVQGVLTDAQNRATALS